ncbi:hypothetical protein, partial [Streptomyces sp. M10]|uniref:hypothetical protein n=1 Tax=Streptomyces sp. M10 TaxID=412968 RepID=UPI00195534A7
MRDLLAMLVGRVHQAGVARLCVVTDRVGTPPGVARRGGEGSGVVRLISADPGRPAGTGRAWRGGG